MTADPAVLTYAREEDLSVAEFRDVLVRSTLGARRPIDDPERLALMLKHANLIVTARSGGRLVGVARSLSDFAYCCYMSDLAVDEAYQHRGIGKALIRATKEIVGPNSMLLLTHAPSAAEYYAKVGFDPVTNGWIIPREN